MMMVDIAHEHRDLANFTGKVIEGLEAFRHEA